MSNMLKFSSFMAGVGLSLLFVGTVTQCTSNAQAVSQKRLVCFDVNGKYKLSVQGKGYRFEHGVVYGLSEKGEYAIFPMPGWVCSIVKVTDGK